jgi:hypothetical protein
VGACLQTRLVWRSLHGRQQMSSRMSAEDSSREVYDGSIPSDNRSLKSHRTQIAALYPAQMSEEQASTASPPPKSLVSRDRGLLM